jgi:hypothetical protein
MRALAGIGQSAAQSLTDGGDDAFPHPAYSKVLSAAILVAMKMALKVTSAAGWAIAVLDELWPHYTARLRCPPRRARSARPTNAFWLHNCLNRPNAAEIQFYAKTI